MNFQLYLILFSVAFTGMLLQTVLKIRSIKIKAKAANVDFVIGDYFKEDWLSMAASLLTIILALFFLGDEGIKNLDSFFKDWSRVIFAFIGYTGSDIASRLFGVISNKINKTIDYKTDVADGKISPNP